MRLTRRTFAWTALAGAAAMSAPAAFAQGAADQKLYEAAKAEGQLTWYTGILDQPICDQVGQAFTRKYPGIRVNAIKTTSQVAFQRLTQDLKAGAVQSDVFTTTDAGHMTFLRSKDELTQFVPENAKGLVEPL